VSEVSTIGLDIAKNVFHAHGPDASGWQLFSRRITRAKILEFFAGQPRCLVALEACGGDTATARCPADPGGLRESVRKAAEE
jgi:transposase